MKFVTIFILLGLSIEIVGHMMFMIGCHLSKKKSFMFITGALYVFGGRECRMSLL